MQGNFRLKILLFNPYYSFTGDTYVFYRASVPYGLVSIATYLKQHDYDTKIYELGVFDEKDVIREGNKVRCGISDEKIRKILEEEKPDIIGIATMYTVFHQDYIDLIRLIVMYDPDIRIVVGGNHASSFPDRMLAAGADQVVVGEGEDAMLSICRGNTDEIVSKELIPSLDRIPLPDYGAIEFKRYIALNNPFSMRMPVAGIQTSRGCPMDCCYCSANGVWKRKWRGRSAHLVALEIFHLTKDYGIKEIHFLDDNIAVDKDRLKEICRYLIDWNMNIKWACPNGIPYWLLDNETLDLMKRSGCYRLTFGIESGDPDIRKYIGKSFPLSKAKEVIDYANKIGIWTVTTNIIGFPYETRIQIQRTIDFAKECGTDFACFFTLLPHESSRVYHDFLKEGLIDPKDSMSALNEGGTPTVNFTKAQIKEFHRIAYYEFTKHKMWQYIKNPMRLIRKVRNLEDLKYLIRILLLGVQVKSRQGKKLSTSKDLIYGKKQYV
jgi:magnesium-protoporphyrin IX monomethyl ester (oxidative) cyclase